jgi:hypothetical protein
MADSETPVPEECASYPQIDFLQADKGEQLGAMLDALDRQVEEYGPDVRTSLHGLGALAMERRELEVMTDGAPAPTLLSNLSVSTLLVRAANL